MQTDAELMAQEMANRPVPVEADEAFRKAKIGLMSKKDSTFFTTLFFNLEHQWDWTVPQAQTNGMTIKYNPEYFLSLDKDQRLSLLLEETLHTAFLHMERMSERDPDRWQKAADHVVRNVLNERGYSLPPDWEFDKAYCGKSTEEVFRMMPVNEPPPNNKQRDLVPPPPPQGGSGDQNQNQGSGGGQAAADQGLRAKVEDLLVQASQAAKMAGDSAGSVPGEFQLFLDQLLNPKLPWHQILRRWFMAQAKTDFTYRKPNKRFYPKYYLPSMLSESLVDVMIGVDISGSVSDEDFNQFRSETHQIMKVLKPKNIRFVQFDTKIQHDDNIRSLRDLTKLEFHGRGGTDPTPLIELAKEVKPKVLLVFTDGEFWGDIPEYNGNLVWLIHNNERFEAPNGKGKVIHYEL